MHVRAALFAVLLAAPAALAQDDGASADILGAWGFEASPTYPGCHLFGQAIIRPGATDNDYSCSIIATDECPNVWSFRAEQTCTATRKGDQLSIQSRIDSVDPPTDRYLPDNFLLTIVSGSQMDGELRSALTTNARFYRTDGPIG